MYRLGHFFLDPQKQSLLAQDKHVHLSRKPYQVLLYLVENRDRLVSRNELLEQFWEGREVYDQTLSKAVGAVRKALGEPREQELFIETRWASGYRYVGPFEDLRAGGSKESVSAKEKLQPADTVPSQSVAIPVLGGSIETKLGQAQRSSAAFSSFRPVRFSSAVVLIALLGGSGLAIWKHNIILNGSASTAKASALETRRQARPSVAVFDFKNMSERKGEEWMGGALAEMVSTELGADGRLRALPGETIARATKELNLGRKLGLAPKSLSAVRQNLGADYVVTGAYTVVDTGREGSSRQLRLDICVQDTKSGETVTSFANNADLHQLFDVAASAGSQMIRALQLPGIEPNSEELARAALPANPAATRMYMEGLEELRKQDLLSARNSLQKAVQEEPEFPLAHLALADAWQRLGYEQNEKDEIGKAFQRSSRLSRELQLYVQARHFTAERNWDKSIETYQTLVELYPDNIEYGLQLTGTQTAAGKPQEAKTTIASLRGNGQQPAEDPRLDMEEATAERALSNFRDSALAAGRAAEKARGRKAPLLYARARALQASALSDVDYEEAIRLSEEARGICQEYQDLGCLANVYRRLGNLKVDSDPNGAETNLREALRLARQLGNRVEEGNDLNSMGVLLCNRGRLREAGGIYEELLKRAKEENSAWGKQMVLNNLGEVQMREGKLTEALGSEQEALGIARQIGIKAGAGDELLDIAEIFELQGELGAAEANHSEALAIFERIASTEGRAVAHTGLGNVARFRGNQVAARDHYQQAIELLGTRADSSELATTRLALARLEREEGRSYEAVALAISAADEYHRVNRTADEASARAFLATLYAEGGNVARAKEQTAKSTELIRGSESVINTLEVEIAEARVRSFTAGTANSNEVLARARQLHALSVRAKNAGLIALQLQAELAAIEVQLHGGHPPASQSSLENLERIAKQNGFLQISRQVSALRGNSSAQMTPMCCGLPNPQQK